MGGDKSIGKRREKRTLARRRKSREREQREDKRVKNLSSAIHLEEAFLAYDDRDLSLAQALVDKSLRLNPRQHDALVLALKIMNAKRAPAADLLQIMRRLQSLGEKSPGFLHDLVLLEARAGDATRAGALIEEQVQLRTKRHEVDPLRAALETGLALRQSDEFRASASASARTRRVKAPKIERVATRPPLPPSPAPLPTSPATATEVPPVAMPPEIEIQIETEIVTPSGLLDRMSSGTLDPIPRLRLSVDAHTLAARERYDELLCLARLNGVERFWHQEEAVKRVLRSFRGRVLLADEVGLGKTIEAGMVLLEYALRGMVRTALILTPASLVPQWREELRAKFGLPAASTDDAAFQSDPDGFLDRHDIVVASLPLARHERQRERFAARSYDLVIVDEAHRVKDHKSESHRLCDRLKSRFLLLLTATPVENDLMELYNLVTLLKPGHLMTRQAFRAEFMERGDPTSPRNRERLRGLLREVMIRNTRALSGARLPPRVVTTIAVDPHPEEVELYGRVLALIRERGRDAPASLLAAAGSSPMALAEAASRLAVSDPVFAGVAKTAASLRSRKDERLLELLLHEPDKTAVFVRFLRSFDHIMDLLREHGVAAVGFRGGMSSEDKDRAVASFRDATPVLVSTDVGSEGLNLQFAANLVNYDLPWNPMRIEQRIGRLHRIGQTREVRVWNLCTRGAAEDRLLDVLDRRLNLFELVIGEMDMVLGQIAEDRAFEEVVADAYRETRDDAGVAARFDDIAERLGAARGRYEKVRKLDEALLGEDYET